MADGLREMQRKLSFHNGARDHIHFLTYILRLRCVRDTANAEQAVSHVVPALVGHAKRELTFSRHFTRERAALGHGGS